MAGETAPALRRASVNKSLSALTGVLPSPASRTSIVEVEAVARQALSPEAQAAAWAAGQAIAEALIGANGASASIA